MFSSPHSLCKFIFIFLVLTLLPGCFQTHQILVKSDPPGATVTDLEKGHLGKTPLTVDVKSEDSLHLTFTKKGYAEEKFSTLNIKKSKTVMVALYERPTYLFVESHPASARLSVTDAATGYAVSLENPSKILSDIVYANVKQKLPPGISMINIALEKEGYHKVTKTVVVEAHRVNKFTFQMKQITTNLRLISSPSGAEVFERYLGFLGPTPLDIDFTWEKLKNLSRNLNTDRITDIPLHLTVKKAGYVDKSFVKNLRVYEYNPIEEIVLIEK